MFLNIIHRATYAQRLTEHGVGITGRPWMFYRQVGVGNPSSEDRGWSTGRVGASFPAPIAAWKLKQTSPAEHKDSEHEIEIKSTNHMEFTWNFSDQISASIASIAAIAFLKAMFPRPGIVS